MEKKTIGQFIAVLRKANGMTQKELAERLNVSDKSVSRWERDETLPDLTLIPVIAEIFGVTSDEILRGEKAVKNESEETPALKSTTKQIQHMFESTKTKFNVKCIVFRNGNKRDIFVHIFIIQIFRDCIDSKGMNSCLLVHKRS